MAESSGKYKLSVASHAKMPRDSNQMLRDIHTSLQHLNVRETSAQQRQDEQAQLIFEQQLALESNINALTQSVAGERRSYPRVTKQFQMEEVKKDFKPLQLRNGTVAPSMSMLNDHSKLDSSHQNFRSSSVTDLSLSGNKFPSKFQMNPNRFCPNSNYFTKHPHDGREMPHFSVYPSNQVPNDQSYDMRQYPSADRPNVINHTPHINQLPHMANYVESKQHVNPRDEHAYEHSGNTRKISIKSHNWGLKPVDPQTIQMQPHYEDVTLRQKPERMTPAQNRWSAEVYALPYDMKPPPPYPGYLKSPHLQRNPGLDTDTVQVGANTPITVIFDEKNDRVNVVGGIPEGYERKPSSSGQSSPRMTQRKDQMHMSSNNPQPQIVQPQIVQPQYILSPNPNQVHQSVPKHLPEPYTNPSQSHEMNFVPIKEANVRERGSPPPYPGRRAMIGSNRSSVNLEELENMQMRELQVNQHHFNDSGISSKGASTSTETAGSIIQSDSSTNASPTPDGVERSCSPLPFTKCPSDSSDIQEKNEEKKEKSSIRLKNCNPQAYKFFMEQHVENVMKLYEQRKHRMTQLEAEMARVGLAEQAQHEMRKLLNKKESNYNRLRRAKMDISMFTKIKTVGVGAFGEVNLVRKNGTNAYYAMKILRKSEVLRRNQVAHVKAERDILAEADNEWVVKLYYSFQNEQNLYFVMDYIPGGDLMALLIKFGIFQPELARFYISELTLAIESVHNLGFIHRDIKPDNVLIDSKGHIKLTDFGLCTGFHWTHDSKYYQPQSNVEGHSRQYSMEPEGGWESLLNDVNCDCKKLKLQNDLCKPLRRRQLRRHTRCQAHSLVGTPNYIAPEVLMRIPYSLQCDWWSLGVILYEMLVGQPPFLAPTPAETQVMVINWEKTLSVPKNVLSKEARDLIRKLCTSPEERLGKEGADEIKRHPYFKGVNFNEIHLVQAPYIPTIKDATDTSNFDPVPDHLISEFNTTETEDKKDGPDYAFYEFTFRHFFDDGGIANPNVDLSTPEKPKPHTPISHTKRPITTSNKSIAVPPKVPAPNSSDLEDKVPIYV